MHNQKRWPPKADDVYSHNSNESGVIESTEITLPPDLYWNCVREFAPIKHRPVLNKRTGSTQFYAGERVELDAEFLKKHGRVFDFTGIPTASGEPGASNFRMHFDVREGSTAYDAANPDAALELLRNSRRSWDGHMSKITCPTARLHACLEIFHCDNHPDLPVELPLLFPGKGEVGDVLRFHMSMNPTSINGPAVSWPGRREFLPNTLLGYWVDQYLGNASADRNDGVHGTSTSQVQEIVRGLLDADPDVTPFFETLGSFPPFRTFSYGYDRFLKPGSSVFQCMTMYLEYCWDDHGGGFDGLDWMIGKLEEVKSKRNHPVLKSNDENNMTTHPLRFVKGDRVECKMGPGPNSWREGTICGVAVSDTTCPYEVWLDEAGLAFVPSDSDDFIRALE